jgi:hypothetical protein
MKKQKLSFIEAFRKACLDHTRTALYWNEKAGRSTPTDYSYPIPGGKYTIDEAFGRNEICIRCKKCWTDDLMIVAKKVGGKFGAKVSGSLSVGGFGTAYNFFTVKL